MATITYAQSQDELASMLHDTDLSNVQNVNGLFRRAGRQLLLELDPQETKRKTTVTLFDEVYDYTSPSDLKKIVDFRPQGVTRSVTDNFNVTKNEEFDLYKSDNGISIEFRDATKVLRISKALTGKLLINDCDSLTANGTWAATGGGSNATADEEFKVQGSASINFDVGSTGGAIENSSMTQIDLSDHDEISTLFVWVYLPDSSIVSNVILRWGNDSSNYWSRTSTTPHFGTAFVSGWNLVSFAWNGATETGTVAPATIDYLRVTVTTTSADTDIRVDEITSKLPHIYELLYYSTFPFRNSSGTWSDSISSDDDTFNMDTHAVNLLLFKTAEYAVQQIGGQDAGFDIQYFQQQYAQGTEKYKSSTPSEAMRPRANYYRIK